MKFTLYILLFINLLSHNIGFAQRNKSLSNLSDEEIFEMADLAMQEEKYEKAVLLYKKLLAKKPNSSQLNFLVGFGYLNTDYGKEQSIEYFNKAIQNIKKGKTDNAPPEVYYYLAYAYYYQNDFTEALDVLNQVLSKIPKNENVFKNRVNILKQSCENAISLSNNQMDLKIENLFDINSKYSDHSALISDDEREIIFTSRREGTKMRVKNFDGQYDENVYTALKVDSVWQVPYSLGSSVNTQQHDAATCISANFKQMLIHRYDRNKGDLYITKRKDDGSWTPAIKLGSNINSKYKETTGCISPDGKELYFTSNRKGGYGGLDLYVSKKQKDGTWGPAKNLGAKINTDKNEETPYLHPNGTLFFCSEGHNTMGGFDIFASSKDSLGNWEMAENMGIPINSIEDDFFYVPSKNGKYAYFSSKRKGGKGKSDIYRISLNPKNKKNYVMLSGRLSVSNKNPIRGSVKFSIQTETGKLVKELNPNLKNNHFTLILEAGKNYILNIEYQNIILEKIKIRTLNYGSYLSLEQHLILDDINIEAIKDTTYNNQLSENIKTLEYQTKTRSSKIEGIDLFASKQTNTQTTSQENQKTQTKSTFTIQLLKSTAPIDASVFKSIEDVKTYVAPDGSFIYYTGDYTYEWEAEIRLRNLINDFQEAKIIKNNFQEENK